MEIEFVITQDNVVERKIDSDTHGRQVEAVVQFEETWQWLDKIATADDRD